MFFKNALKVASSKSIHLLFSSKPVEDAPPTDPEASTADATASDKPTVPKPTISKPTAPSPPLDTIITNLFGTTLNNRFRCRCGQEMSRQITSTLYDLVYPDVPPREPILYHFCQVVAASLRVQQVTQAWCNKCDKYQPHVSGNLLHWYKKYVMEMDFLSGRKAIWVQCIRMKM